jgi:hypothetical protein
MELVSQGEDLEVQPGPRSDRRAQGSRHTQEQKALRCFRDDTMDTRIATAEHIKEFEVSVRGPDRTNRLLAIVGTMVTPEISAGKDEPRRETYTCLVGPKLSDHEFLGASCLTSITNVDVQGFDTVQCAVEFEEVEWDDESGQVELCVEVSAAGGRAVVTVMYAVMILRVG